MSNNTQTNVATRQSAYWIPVFFVFLWSTGFIVAKFGLPFAPPLTFLLLRCGGVLLVLVPLVWAMKAPWPTDNIGHIAVAGLLLQAGYLGGVWCAIKLGMPAGVTALIVGMQPILTAACAPLIGESVRPRQWLGLLFGLAGVALVVYAKMSLAGLSALAIGYCVLALLLPLAIVFEDLTPALATVEWTPSFIGALLWSVFALSIGAIFLLFTLLRRNDATVVTSLLYLTPPTTAVMAWLMFGEAFTLLGVAGMAVAVIGVVCVVKK